MILTILVFILVISVVVISHEFGHFLLAKMNGIKVVEFAVGMGPALLKFQKGETRYVLRLLPIGGACMMEGEDGISSDEDETSEEEQLSDVTGQVDASIIEESPVGKTSGKFSEANVWAKISVVIAGPLFNILLAFILSMILVGATGEVLPIVTDTMEGYPAQEAGLQKGDKITKIAGEKVYLQSEISMAVFMNGNQDVEVEYERDGQRIKTVIVPKYSEEDGTYYLGLMFGEHVDARGFQVLKYSAYEVRYWLRYTVKSLMMMIKGQVSKDDVAGPVGIAMVIDETIESTAPYGISTVILTLINFAVLLSVNLGVLNLLPIPALDGGRLLFLFLEVLRGKPIPPEKEGIVHFVGFVALMIVMVLVMYNDIARIFAAS